MNKHVLRSLMKTKRDALDTKTRSTKNSSISKKLISILDQNMFATSDVYLTVYQAMGSEVDLACFIEAAYERSVHVCFPCMTTIPGSESRMVMRDVPGAYYGKEEVPFLSQPLVGFAVDNPAVAEFAVVEPARLDMAVVPLLAFDEQRNRLGYGGGNYDRFLPQLSEKAVVVGVAYEEQKAEHIPLEKHDMPLPRIITG